MVKRGIKIKSLALVLVALFILFFTIKIVLSVPNTLTLQGKLTNIGGSSLSGTYNMSFKIYDAYTSGNILWEKEINVTTDANGVYDVIFTNVNLNFSDKYYLGITVGTDGESSPRINLTSSPYAFRSNISEDLNPENEYTVSALHVTGKGNFSQGIIIGTTSDLDKGSIRLNNGVFQGYNGSDWIALGNSTAAAGNLWSASGANIYYDSGNVGIGTGTPDTKLKVVGDVNVTGIVWSQGINITSGSSGGGGWTDDGSIIRLTSSSDLVGIGTTLPTEKLYVSGNGTFTEDLVVQGNLIGIEGGGGAGSASFGWVDDGGIVRLATSTDLVGIGTTNPNYALQVASGTDGRSVNLSNVLFVNGSNGRIGIGTTSSAEKLVVIGNVNISGTLNVSGRVSFPDLSNCNSIDTDSDGILSCGTDETGSVTAGTALNVTWLNSSKQTLLATGSGNVGIGTTSPGKKLEVAGIINATGLNITGTDENATFEGDVQIKGTLYGGSPLKIGGGLNITSGELVFADGTTQSTASSSGTVNSSAWNLTDNEVIPADPNYNVSVNASVLFVDTTNDRVGIGTTSPGYKLDVSGRSRFKAGSDISAGFWLRNVADTSDSSFIGR